MERKRGSALHCFPGPSGRGRWGYGGGRTPLPLEAEIHGVYPRLTQVSLRHACLAAGLLDEGLNGAPLNWARLGDLIQHKWGESMDRFLADASSVGITLESADAAVAHLRGAVIGWTATGDGNPPDAHAQRGVCADACITLGILGRRIGDVFIASRAPDYSWSTLFESAFEFDDSLVDAPALSDRPWAAFPWGYAPEQAQRSRRRRTRPIP